ncbi:MAG: tRNA (adenosine(37)-N6)-threonylcarbamoyltransferase complex ATPase subunit type 1 TsaE [Ruminococcus sp.]|nr:tRNA (adenosine(37)-N6)-threonylcarbamoyltransferase complex ATPase subunit type 1 TsaE [Ruminococcus sp.]
MKIITRSANETIELGKKIGSRLKGGEVLAYTGGLGAGKTTMTRGISLGMGLGDEVTSPTFALVNEYHADTPLSLYHFDMYRITSSADLETTGFYDYMDDNSVICVEWSENISDELPIDTIYIDIKRVDDDCREITLTGDERFEDIGD